MLIIDEDVDEAVGGKLLVGISTDVALQLMCHISYEKAKLANSDTDKISGCYSVLSFL